MPTFVSKILSSFVCRWLGTLLLLCATLDVQAQQIDGSNRPASDAIPATTAPPPANYILSVNDLLQVKVFQEDDMNWTVRVNKDGNIVLPLVGSINATKKTPEDLAGAVRDRLHDGWLVHPQVSVAVLEFSKRRFTILGQITKPGQIDFPDNSTVDVLQAIGMAGGFTRNADPGRVYVKRKLDKQQIVLKVDARRMARDATTTPFEILPGDTITVAETVF